jgi:transposase-like protein
VSDVVRDTGTDETDPDDAPPLAPDRPFVDGTAASPEELRAEVRRLSNDERQHVDDLREEVGESVAALASRFDVKARVAEKRDDAVATVQQQVGRVRSAAAEGAVVAKDTARQQPGVLAAVAAALLVLLVIVLRRRRG